jgi:hypothetical protein
VSGTCCDLSSVVVASDVHVGDVVFVLDSSEGSAAAPTTVVSVDAVRRAGAYNVHTLSGSIVVDGVVATHFTQQTTWTSSGRRYAHWWYRLLHITATMLGTDVDHLTATLGV